MHGWSSETVEILGIWELDADHDVSVCVPGRVSPSPSQESLNSSKSDTDAGVGTQGVGRRRDGLVCNARSSLMLYSNIKEFLACVFLSNCHINRCLQSNILRGASREAHH